MSDPVEALFASIRAGDVAAVSALVAQRPELAAARNPQGISAVLWACYTHQPEALAAVLAARPSLDLFEAAAAGLDEDVRARLERVPDLVHAWSTDGFTALHLAAYFGHAAAATRLLSLGADARAEARNATRVTPLHSAVAAGAHAIAAALLERGADPDARQQQGFTALMAAAQQGDAAMVERLLAQGADPGLCADDGRAAADFADQESHHALAATLRDAKRRPPPNT